METLNIQRLKSVTAGLIFATINMAAPVEADAPPKPQVVNASQPPADPFVKTDAPVPKDESTPAVNLVLSFEVYQLSQAEGSALIQENETDEARHDRVLELVKSDKASLEAVLCGAVQSGRRVAVEQVISMYFPQSFDFSPGKGSVGRDFRQRKVGYRLDVNGEETLDKKGFNATLFLERTNFGGYLEQSLQDVKNSESYHVSLARFEAQKVSKRQTVFLFEKTCFLGTYNPIPEDSLPPKTANPGSPTPESKMRLVFGKISRFQLNPATVQAAIPAGLEQQFSIYSMDRDSARQILSQKQEADSSFQAVQALMKTNQAKLERLSVLRTTNETKNNFAEVAEIRYPAQYLGDILTQEVGLSGEATNAFIGHSSLLTLDITNCQIMNYLGNLPVEGVAAYFHQSMPLFEVRSITTSVYSGLGEHELLGTISPAGDTGLPGQKDTGRVWLEFVQTTAINP